MLILKDIKKKYEGSKKYVLKDINLVFKEKGIVSILGESGSGKTTLLNIIGGLDTPTKGNVFIDRKNINELRKNNSLYTKYIGFIFQNYNLIDYLTTKENINLISKLSPSNILRTLSISKHEEKIVKNLSGGERQRVAIARALIRDKTILLCDEPTGALDSETSEKIMKLLKKIAKDHLVIVVTHNIELAKTYSDRIIKIKDGMVISDSDPISITERKSNYKNHHEKYSLRAILNYVGRNIVLKKKKTIFSIIAYIIGLSSLLLVLSISLGFNEAIKYEEKRSMAQYPIIISEYSTNIEEELNNLTSYEDTSLNYIYSKPLLHKNNLDQSLINYINNNSNTKYIIKKYLINDITLSTYDKNIMNELNLIYGEYPTLGNEILLIVNDYNRVDENLLNSINLNEKKYRIDELTGHLIQIENEYFSIVGIAKFDEESPLYDENGLFLKEEIQFKVIPYEIYLYPIGYKNKVSLLNYLNKYPNLSYTDYATTLKHVSTTIIDSITTILVIFSFITLSVSCIMNYLLTLISINERIREIGIFKVNGIDNKVIKFMFYLENNIISTIGILISLLFVATISIPVNNILVSITGLNNIIMIDFNIIVLIMIVTYFLTFISTYFPTRRVSKMKIIDNLMHNN